MYLRITEKYYRKLTNIERIRLLCNIIGNMKDFLNF